MNKLLILSRDAHDYKQLIERANLPNLDAIDSATGSAQLTKKVAPNILFGEPDLCAQVLSDMPSVKWMQSTWAGVKPLIELERADFLITGVKGIFGEQMREYIFSYILHFHRQVGTYMQQQREHKWSPQKSTRLSEKTIAILGTGSIGYQVAATAKHFGMHVMGISRHPRKSEFVDVPLTLEQLPEVAKRVDYLVSLLPDTKETQGVINSKFLNSLPEHCVLINAGRAKVIDSDALEQALKQKRIRAAVLDVFAQEPLPATSPFWDAENVIVTPHCAGVSHPQDIAPIFIQNYQYFEQGAPLNYLIDAKLGY